MYRYLRYFMDGLMVIYTLFAVYYLFKIILQLIDAYTHTFNFGFIFDHPLRFAVIYGTIIFGHILISLWMYVDVGRRRFSSENQRLYWLGIISAGLAPIYYFYHGRND